MAFRIETRIGAILILAAATAFPQSFTFEVRHRHLHGGTMGTLRIDAERISFAEHAKHGKHSRQWAYSEIQQLSLGPAELRILTYEDQKWQLGRDRDYVFDKLPEGLAASVYPLLASHLDQRFVAQLAEAIGNIIWQTGAKLRHGLGGSEGTLLVADDRIVYQSKEPGESRTWRLQDIDQIASAGSFDLAITTLERSGWLHAGPAEFRFQLKEPISEQRYNELWRRLYRFQSEQAQAGRRAVGQ